MPKAPSLLLSLLLTALSAAEPTGTLCLLPGDFDAFAKGAATVTQQPAPRPPESERYVQVDNLPPAKVTSRTAGRIHAIPATGRHKVQIAKQPTMREPISTFFFRFEENRTTQLCLFYETFYGTWRLKPCPCPAPKSPAPQAR